MFYMLLSKFESMTLSPTLRDIIKHFDQLNYTEVKNLAHTLKGTAGYIGASRLYYQCYYMQLHYCQGEYDIMMRYYPGLVEAAVDFKVACRELLAEKMSK